MCEICAYLSQKVWQLFFLIGQFITSWPSVDLCNPKAEATENFLNASEEFLLCHAAWVFSSRIYSAGQKLHPTLPKDSSAGTETGLDICHGPEDSAAASIIINLIIEPVRYTRLTFIKPMWHSAGLYVGYYLGNFLEHHVFTNKNTNM